jgi:prefoldin beta subunit
MDKESEQIIGQAQLYGQQMQNIAAQKTALVMELNEMKKSLEELEKSGEKTVFKISGAILIKADAEVVRKELNDKKEMITFRMKTLERQGEKMKEKIEELRTRMINVRPSKKEE